MEFLTTKEVSEIWGISPRRVALLCEEGRVVGTEKKGKTWLIPSEAKKPKDGRLRKSKSNEKYRNIEKNFNIIYPNSKNATYTSLLNYSDDLNKPYQRWYRYKEGFSVELVQYLIGEYSKSNGIILDPFMGSGTTLLAATKLGFEAVGYEVNPFSYFLSKCKLEKYSQNEIELFKSEYERIIKISESKRIEYSLPNLSISSKVFNKNIEQYYMTIGVLIERVDNKKVSDLLKLGWLACLEPLSNYRKAGNGLKYKKYSKPKILTISDAKIMLLEEYQNIYIDLLKKRNKKKYNIFNKSCIDMKLEVKNDTIDGIVFSPPYANCFDYTEIYKLELWFGKFVHNYSDLKELKKNSLHSHLNGNFDNNVEVKSAFLEELIEELKTKKLWDKKIPQMLNLYYDDMFKVIEECYRVLHKGGFCSIIVGNSAYGGIVFPTDLILSEYAQRIGFAVDKIEVDRFIITSSQQYELTKESRKYLRESIICLIKK